MSPQARLGVLMVAHTAVVAVSITAIGYGLWRGLFGFKEGDLLLALALAWPALIGLGLLLNRGECLLQTWARRLAGRENGWTRDMLWVPEAWATRIPQVFTPPYLIALGLCLGRLLQQGGLKT
jgi:hypothetical protein